MSGVVAVRSSTVDTYRCLETGCSHSDVIMPDRTELMLHLHEAHKRRFTIHRRWIIVISYRFWAAWLRYVLKNFLTTLTGCHNELYSDYRCQTGNCTAFLTSRERKTADGTRGYEILYVGEHYGHPHQATEAEQLFLLECFSLAPIPIEQWLQPFAHTGITLFGNDNSNKHQSVVSASNEKCKGPRTIGMATQHQLNILRALHKTLVIYSLGTSIAFFSTVTNGRSIRLLPVAYMLTCRDDFNLSDMKNFLAKLSGPSNILSQTTLVVSNIIHLLTQSWYSVIGCLPIFVPSQFETIEYFYDYLNKFYKYQCERDVESCARELQRLMDLHPRDVSKIMDSFTMMIEVNTSFDLSDMEYSLVLLKHSLVDWCTAMCYVDVHVPNSVAGAGDTVYIMITLLKNSLPEIVNDLLIFSQVMIADIENPDSLVNRQLQAVAISKCQ